MHILQIFSLIVSISAFYTTEEQVCGCYNITSECCTVIPFTFEMTQTINSGDDTSVDTVSYGNFSKVYVNNAFAKSNFNLVSSTGPVDCSEIHAYIFESDLQIVPYASITLIQETPSVCFANFSKQIKSSYLTEELDVVIGFKYDEDETFTMFLREGINGYTLPNHVFIVSENAQDTQSLDLGLNIQINDNSIHNASCLTAENEDNIQFQFVPADNAHAANCIFNIDEIVLNEAQRTARLDITLTQNQYILCRSSFVDTGTELQYAYVVRPIIAGCDYYVDYDDYTFTVSVSTILVVNNSVGVGDVVDMSILEETVTIVPCPDEEMKTDVSSLIPMAKLVFDVEVNTTYSEATTLAEVLVSQFGDLRLEILSGPTYTPIGATHTSIHFTFITTECLWVDTQHSGEVESQENLIGCSVDYLPVLNLQIETTFGDGSSQVESLSIDERSVSFQTDNTSLCPVTALSNDVTQMYGATLIIENVDGATANLNLNAPIRATIKLNNGELAESDGVSVILSQILVNLDDEYIRLFDEDDKSAQMHLDFIPYYSDGHFCRKFDATNQTCSKFSQQTDNSAEYSSNNWNSFLDTQHTDNSSTSLFDNDARGGRKIKYCEHTNEYDRDSFIFTPSNWVFDSFPRTTGRMEFVATAFLRYCTVDSSGRRRLQDNPQSTVVFNNVSIINSNVIINNGGGSSSDGSGFLAKLESMTLIIIALVVIICLLFVYAFCGSYLKSLFFEVEESVFDRMVLKGISRLD